MKRPVLISRKPIEIEPTTSEIAGKVAAYRETILSNYPEDFLVGDFIYRTHIRLNTPIYRWDSGRPGFKDTLDCEKWENYIRNVIEGCGLKVDDSKHDAQVRAVYPHPDALSGELSAEEITLLVEGLQSQKGLSSAYRIDIYHEIEIMASEELIKRIRSQGAALRANILDAHHTNRVWKFRFRDNQRYLAGLIGVTVSNAELMNAVKNEIDGMIAEMLDIGIMIRHPDDGNAMRSANKTEQRALRRAGRISQK